MTPEQLRERTQIFAASIVKLCIDLRTKPGGRRIADQLEDAATSTAANYRAVCRAHPRPTFIAKLSIVVEEADETLGWLETLERAGVMTPGEVALQEGSQRAGGHLRSVSTNGLSDPLIANRNSTNRQQSSNLQSPIEKFRRSNAAPAPPSPL